MKKFIVSTLITACMLCSVNAMAALYVYTDRALWLSNVSGVVTETFDAYSGQELASLTLGPVTFDVPGDTSSTALWVSIPGIYTPIASALVGNHWLTTVRATFSSPYSAVGADVGNLSVDDTINISVIDNASQVTNYQLSYLFPTMPFFGVTTDSGFIASISFAPTTSNWVGIDNFSYGTSTSTPEPSTFLLLGAGLGGLALLRKKSRK